LDQTVPEPVTAETGWFSFRAIAIIDDKKV